MTSKTMKNWTRNFNIMLVGLLIVSCDPDINVDYSITNQSNDNLRVVIYGLRDSNNGVMTTYDTLVKINDKLNIYTFSSLGSDYSYSADTVDIYDSIRIIKGNTLAKSDFKRIDKWTYTTIPGKWGGGQYKYELKVKNEDF